MYLPNSVALRVITKHPSEKLPVTSSGHYDEGRIPGHSTGPAKAI